MPDPLLELLRIGPEDLEANRDGRLGPRQKRRRRRNARLSLAGFVLLGALLIAGGIKSHAAGGQWLVPVTLGVVSLVGGVLAAPGNFRAVNAPVRRLSGRVDVGVASTGRAGNALVLHVGGQRCRLPRGNRARWRAALAAERPHHVYVTGAASPDVVAIEPA